SLLPDSINLFLDGELAQAGEGKAKKQHDSSVENQESLAISAFDLFGRSYGGSGIGNSPVSRHGLARPNGADFACRVVADRKHEIHFRSSRLLKFVPAFAAQALGGHTGERELLQRFAPDQAG